MRCVQFKSWDGEIGHVIARRILPPHTIAAHCAALSNSRIYCYHRMGQRQIRRLQSQFHLFKNPGALQKSLCRYFLLLQLPLSTKAIVFSFYHHIPLIRSSVRGPGLLLFSRQDCQNFFFWFKKRWFFSVWWMTWTPGHDSFIISFMEFLRITVR